MKPYLYWKLDVFNDIYYTCLYPIHWKCPMTEKNNLSKCLENAIAWNFVLVTIYLSCLQEDTKRCQYISMTNRRNLTIFSVRFALGIKDFIDFAFHMQSSIFQVSVNPWYPKISLTCFNFSLPNPTREKPGKLCRDTAYSARIFFHTSFIDCLKFLSYFQTLVSLYYS